MSSSMALLGFVSFRSHRIWAFTESSRGRVGTLTAVANTPDWLVDTRHRVLVCSIYKNSMSQWLRLMFEATSPCISFCLHQHRCPSS